MQKGMMALWRRFGVGVAFGLGLAAASAPVSAMSLGSGSTVTDVPGECTATANANNGQVQLRWEAAQAANTGYLVDRRVYGGAAWETLTDSPTKSKTYTDKTTVNGTAYEYRVRTQLKNPPAGGATEEPRCSAPAAVFVGYNNARLSACRAEALDNGEVMVSWNASVASQVQIGHRYTKNGSLYPDEPVALAETDAPALDGQYRHAQPAPGTRNQYSLQSVLHFFNPLDGQHHSYLGGTCQAGVTTAAELEVNLEDAEILADGTRQMFTNSTGETEVRGVFTGVLGPVQLKATARIPRQGTTVREFTLSDAAFSFRLPNLGTQVDWEIKASSSEAARNKTTFTLRFITLASSPAPAPVVRGLTRQLYAQTPAALDDLDAATASATAPVAEALLATTAPVQRFQGFLRVPRAGEYTLELHGVSAAQVRLAGVRVLATDAAGSPQSRRLYLAQGDFALDLRQAASTADRHLRVYLRGPGLGQQPLRADWLWRAPLAGEALADTDADGYPDGYDAFPAQPLDWLDRDGDGIADAADADRDGDGVANAQDLYPDDGLRVAGEGSHPLVANPAPAGNAVNLSWAHQLAGDEQGYQVWRAGANGLDPVLLTPQPLTGNSYADAQVSAGQAYVYFLTMSTSRGDARPLSAHPQALFLAAPVAAPSACTAELVGDGIQLTWQGQADAYRLVRSQQGGDPAALSEVATTAYRDLSVRAGGHYRYGVYARRLVNNPLTHAQEWRESAMSCDTAELAVPSRMQVAISGGTPTGDNAYQFQPPGPGDFTVQGQIGGALGPVRLVATSGATTREASASNGNFSLVLPVDFEHAEWNLSVVESEAVEPVELHFSLRFQLDREAPVITLAADQEALTWADRIRVRGVASDAGSGVASVLVRHLGRAEEQVASLDGQGGFEASIALDEGDNALEILARDQVGNQARLAYNVRRDSTPPSLTLSSPDEGVTVYQDRIGLSGEVHWAHAVSALSLSLNGQALSLTPAGTGIYRFEQASVPLAAGANTLSVELAHPFGHSQAQRHVTYEPDETGPQITLATANPTRTWLAELTVTGRVSDAQSGFARAWLVRAGSAEEQALSVAGDGAFSVNLALAEGDNGIIFWAEDQNGNRTQSPLTLVRDSTPATLTVLTPTDGTTVYTDRATVSGRVTWGHDAGVLQLTLNGAPVSLAPAQAGELAFSLEQTLAEGDNVLAFNLATPLGTIQRQVLVTRVRDESAPVVSLDPVSDPVTAQAQFTVSGQVSDTGSGLARVWLTSDQYPDEFAVTPAADGKFQVDAPLKLGQNSLTILARDKAGNEGRQSLAITRDDGRPTLTITAPAYGTRVEVPTVTVSGSVSWRGEAGVLALTVAGRATALVADGERSYRFEAKDVPLSEGTNDVLARLSYPEGAREQLVRVIYQKPVTPPEDLAPALEIRSPVAGSVLNGNDQTLQVRVTGSARPLLVKVNDTPIDNLEWLDDSHARFSLPLHFEAGQGVLGLALSARDAKGREATLSASYSLDILAPEINVPGLAPFPARNEMTETPFRLTGTVTEAHLASLSLNGQPLTVTALSGDSYGFTSPIALANGEERTITLTARDQAGNQTSREFVLHLSGEVDLSVLLPRPDSQFYVDGANLDLEVTARVGGISAEHRLRAQVDDGEWVALGVDGELAQGVVPVPPATGSHNLNVEVIDSTDAVVQRRSVAFHLEDYAAIPLSVSRTQPENDAIGIEPNEFIAVHFNKPLDPAKLRVSVRETAHGLTYVNKDEAGTEFLNAQGAVLDNIDREQDVVPGTLEILPGNRSVVFHPSRDLAYSGQVFIEVHYDDAELKRFAYRTRPLPTFVTGLLMDNLDQPIGGVSVRIPELKREAKTDGDGAFAFGFGDSAAEALPAGRYRLVFNDGLADRRFASGETWISIEEGRRNETGFHRLSLINQQVPFQHVRGGDADVVLAEGDLHLDLAQAGLRFPDGGAEGLLHSQFLEFKDLDRPVNPAAVPNWVFAQQPAGIRVTGQTSVRFNVPTLNGSYDYLPPVEFYVVLVGGDASGKNLLPIGVGQLKDHQVTSQGKLELTTLDYIGFAFVREAQQELLKRYVDGTIGLAELTASLQQP